jgi:signal peptidase I
MTRQVVETLMLAFVIYLIATLVIQPYQVDGESMEPNLDGGERLFVNRTVYLHFDLNALLNLLPGDDREGTHIIYPFHAPERGDIVVFNPPTETDKPYIKRVIGLPGETVTFRDGYVYVDGRKLDEPYINGAITRCANGEHCEVTVPDGYIYVLGDNRLGSSDSRRFGLVSLDSIIGKAWFANWPIDDIGLLPDYDYDE